MSCYAGYGVLSLTFSLSYPIPVKHRLKAMSVRTVSKSPAIQHPWWDRIEKQKVGISLPRSSHDAIQTVRKTDDGGWGGPKAKMEEYCRGGGAL